MGDPTIHWALLQKAKKTNQLFFTFIMIQAPQKLATHYPVTKRHMRVWLGQLYNYILQLFKNVGVVVFIIKYNWHAKHTDANTQRLHGSKALSTSMNVMCNT